MNRWDTLTMSEKNQLLGIYASKGYNNLANIIAHYNSFAEGGNVDGEGDDIDNRTGKPRYRRDIQGVSISSSSNSNIKGAARDTSTIGPLAFYPPKYYISKQGNQFEENPNVTYDSWFDEHPEMIDVMTDIVGRYNNRLNNRGQQLPQLNRFYFEQLYNPEGDPVKHEAIERLLNSKWNRDLRAYNDNRTLNLWDTVEKFPVTTTVKNTEEEYQYGGKLNDPPFVRRFSETPIRYVNMPSIIPSNNYATHLLGYSERDGKYYVYPSVQPEDYKDTKSKLKYFEDWRKAEQRAIDNDDYLEFDNEEDARNYTENYKRIPYRGASLNSKPTSFATGGHLYQDAGTLNRYKPDYSYVTKQIFGPTISPTQSLSEGEKLELKEKQFEKYLQDYKRQYYKPTYKDLHKDGVVERFDEDAVKWNNQHGLDWLAMYAGARALPSVLPNTMNFLGRPFTTLTKNIKGATPYMTSLDKSLWSVSGLAAMYNAGYNRSIQPWYNTAGEVALGLPMMFEMSPAIKGGAELFKDGVKFADNTVRKYNPSYDLYRTIQEVTPSISPVENAFHNRFRLGDVEINNPELLYHVQPDNGIGLLYKQGSGAYIKDGMLFPGKGLETETPYTWWNLGKPYINKYDIPQTKMLITTPKDNPSMLHVRSQNYPIGQWNGSRGFVTNSEYVSSEPVKIGNQYIFEPKYGYKRIGNEIPTLDQAMKEAIVNQQNNPIVFTRSLSNEGLDNILRDNYLEGSPSLALTRYSDNNIERLSNLYSRDGGITFLFGKDAAGSNAKYFIGDADTPIRQDAARILQLTPQEFESITPEQVLKGKKLLHNTINQEKLKNGLSEAIRETRNNNFGDLGSNYNEVLLDKILDYRKAKGAILNTSNPKYIKLLEDLKIPYGNSISDLMYKGFQRGGSLGHITPYGQWQYPHQVTTIPSNNITMRGVDYPVVGISNTGDVKYMLPNMDYLFDGQYVTEYPIK